MIKKNYEEKNEDEELFFFKWLRLLWPKEFNAKNYLLEKIHRWRENVKMGWKIKLVMQTQ